MQPVDKVSRAKFLEQEKILECQCRLEDTLVEFVMCQTRLSSLAEFTSARLD